MNNNKFDQYLPPKNCSLGQCNFCNFVDKPKCVFHRTCREIEPKPKGLTVITIPQEEADRVNRLNITQNKAYYYLENHNYQKAILYFIETLSLRLKNLPPIDPEYAEIYPYMATADSISAIKGVQLNDLLHLGIAFRKTGAYERACEIFNELMEFCQTLDKDKFPYYMEEIVFYFHKRIKEVFLSEVWTELGKVYIDQGLFLNALEVYTTKLNPKVYPYLPWKELMAIFEGIGDSKKLKMTQQYYKKYLRRNRVLPFVIKVKGLLRGVYFRGSYFRHKKDSILTRMEIAWNYDTLMKLCSNMNVKVNVNVNVEVMPNGVNDDQ